MERTPRVTVLMAVHNGRRYLREAIDSILGQSFTDFEFLIIDDGSTDGSSEGVREYSDSRIRLIRNGAKVGLAASLNRGLQMARGEYVARMDCDDASLPARLAEQTAFMDRNPQIGVCGSWIRHMGEGGAPGKMVRYSGDPEFIRAGLLFNSTVAHPSVMLRKEFFTRYALSYDPALGKAQDYELWMRASRHMRLSNLQKVLLHYRTHPGQGASGYEEQQGVAGNVRRAMLATLGIDPTDEEWQIHQALATCRIGSAPNIFALADRWLCRLLAANKAAGSFEEPAFTRMLVERWITFIKKGGAEGGACRALRHLPAFLARSGGMGHAARFLFAEASARFGRFREGRG